MRYWIGHHLHSLARLFLPTEMSMEERDRDIEDFEADYNGTLHSVVRRVHSYEIDVAGQHMTFNVPVEERDCSG